MPEILPRLEDVARDFRHARAQVLGLEESIGQARKRLRQVTTEYARILAADRPARELHVLDGLGCRVAPDGLGIESVVVEANWREQVRR